MTTRQINRLVSTLIKIYKSELKITTKIDWLYQPFDAENSEFCGLAIQHPKRKKLFCIALNSTELKSRHDIITTTLHEIHHIKMCALMRCSPDKLNRDTTHEIFADSFAEHEYLLWFKNKKLGV